ncbi:MAG: oxidoreductase [Ignavibacteriae bacterium HGW-Ignavibacteriae-3]|nr:MAG: oxidoreductase [Ignavibacteriae bacterium HGW-Ignavibacteriae-3]
MLLKEKYGVWALITGASAGIGEEFAKRFASENINLILVARREEKLNKLAAELKTKNDIEVVSAPVDLSEPNFIVKLQSYIGDREISILVNNAGFGYNGEFQKAELKNQIDMISVNCLAPTIITHNILQGMVNRKKGAIIFLGSLVGYQPTPFTTSYSATKAFNLFMGEGLWYELKKYNIDVLALNPGGTKTEFQKVANTSAGPYPRDVSQVVDTALKHLGKRMSVVDGFMNKVLSIIPRFITRRMTVLTAGKIRKTYFT